MKITIDIDTPEEMKEIASFLKKKRENTSEHSVSERRARLEKLFSEVTGHLPSGYKFDRDQAHERTSLH